MKVINHFTTRHFVLSLFVLTMLFAGSFATVARAETATPTAKDSLQKMIDDLLAQIKALQEQMDTLPGDGCFQFTKSMYLGSNDASTNGEVSKLQEYLTSTGDYTYSKVTGHFGVSTEAAVKKWQARNGIVSSGTPASTGYGLVGKATRAAMNKSCNEDVSTGGPRVGLEIISPVKGAEYEVGDFMHIKFDSVGVSSASVALYKDDKWAYWIYKDMKVNENTVTAIKWEITKDVLGAIGDGKNLKIYVTGRKSDNSGYKDAKSGIFSIDASEEDSKGEVSVTTAGYKFLGENNLNPTLFGQVNLKDEEGADVWFEWSLDKKRLETDADTLYGINSSQKEYVTVSKTVSALATQKGGFDEGKKYYYRINAIGSEGRIRGGIQSFIIIDEEAVDKNIVVTSPNGGEKWNLGDTNTITWAPYQYNPDVNPASEVTAYLDQMVGGKFVEVGKIMDNGKASIHTRFEIGDYEKWPKGGEYYVRVVNNRTGATDRSDKPFTLLSKDSGIKVTSPNGGEKWTVGKTNTITWAPYQYNPNINPSTDVKAYLDKMVDGKFVQVGRIMESGKASIHTYLDIDKFGNYPEAGSYYVRVVNTKTGDTDRSDKPFTLVAPLPYVSLQAQYIVEDGFMNKKDYASSILVTADFTEGTDYCVFIGTYSNGGKVTKDIEVPSGNFAGVGFSRVGPYPNLVLRSVAVDCNHKGKSLTATMPIEPAGFSSNSALFDILVNGVSYESGTSIQAEAYARCERAIEDSEMGRGGLLECKWNGTTFFKKSSWKG